jgi:hypothetical protein
MVASSVVSTILILNYHHRNANTHEMSDWVSFVCQRGLKWPLSKTVVGILSEKKCVSMQSKHHNLSR